MQPVTAINESRDNWPTCRTNSYLGMALIYTFRVKSVSFFAQRPQ